MDKIIDSKRIEDLCPYMQSICREHIKRAESKIPNSKVITTSTLRNQARQSQLYSYGREDKTKTIVTNAKLIKGHGFGLAYDLAVIINNKAIYKPEHLPKDYPLTYSEIWNIIGTIGEELGLEWALRWKSFPETCHFQILEGITTQQLHSGRRPSVWYKKPIDFQAKPKNPFEVLKSKNIISKEGFNWEQACNDSYPINGIYCKALITNFYKYKTKKWSFTFTESVDYLVDNKISSDMDYWINYTQPNQKCSAINVKLLIQRMADSV